MTKLPESGLADDDTEDRRDALLLKLLKTPPHPRPKRERKKGGGPKAPTPSMSTTKPKPRSTEGSTQGQR